MPTAGFGQSLRRRFDTPLFRKASSDFKFNDSHVITVGGDNFFSFRCVIVNALPHARFQSLLRSMQECPLLFLASRSGADSFFPDVGGCRCFSHASSDDTSSS